MLGVLMQYIYTGEPSAGTAAEFFWDAVVKHHTYATGGHGKDEYFGPPNQLAERVDGRTDESCNVYNMLKMTRRLFAIHPDIKYADFEERALFNHVLASIDPEDGRTCYMVPVGRGVRHEYQEMSRDFTCCVGSGMESHSLHGDGVYYESGDRLWINLYVPSVANWKAAGATVTMTTTFPEGDAASLKLTLQRQKSFTLALRRPSWAGDGFAVKVNGKSVMALAGPGSYVELKRTWRSGDTVSLVLPKKLHVEELADNERSAALMWGPLVLAGDLGPERRGGPTESPALVTADKPVTEWLQPMRDSLGVFRTVGVGRGTDGQTSEVDFVPFYRLHRRTYSVYWDLYTNESWATKIEELNAERARQQKLEAATVAYVPPGDLEKEKTFYSKSEASAPDRISGRVGRRSKKWFSYELPVDAARPMALVVTLNTEERAKRTFEILVDGQRIGDGVIERYPPGSPTGRFYDVDYKIPASLVKDKQKVTVRFQATGGNETATVFGIRLVHAEER
jgi:hypothetical protein